MIAARLRVKQRCARQAGDVAFARDGVRRTGRHTNHALSATRHSLNRRRDGQRLVGQHGGQTDTRSVLGGDKQRAFPDPAQAGQDGGGFMLENARVRRTEIGYAL